MKIAVLSPHFDDAVLSCWHVLEGDDDVSVLNTFTGSPAPDAPVAWWDRATGAQDSATRMLERTDEDRAALALIGRNAVNLGLLDAQYATKAEGAAAQLAAQVGRMLAADTVVHAPAGLGGHPDHAIVRDAALALARAGRRVRLYADLPHATARGWPDWVLGSEEWPGAEIAADWASELSAAGVIPNRLLRHVEPLGAGTRARKLHALATYRTQRAALDDIGFAPLDEPRALAYEVSWEVPPSALCHLQQALGEPRVADAGCESLDERG